MLNGRNELLPYHHQGERALHANACNESTATTRSSPPRGVAGPSLKMDKTKIIRGRCPKISSGFLRRNFTHLF